MVAIKLSWWIYWRESSFAKDTGLTDRCQPGVAAVGLFGPGTGSR